MWMTLNHKRGKPKKSRAGCLFCKQNKMNGLNKDNYVHYGFGKLRKLFHAKKDMVDDSYPDGAACPLHLE
jgi:hypothetical protein